jgi:hypothetical protein
MAKRRTTEVDELANLQEAKALVNTVILRGDDQRLVDAAALLLDKISEHVVSGRAIGGDEILSDDAEKVWYLHAQDGDNYEHVFEDGARMLLLGEASSEDDEQGNVVLLYRPDGRDVWAEFETDDDDDSLEEEEEPT